MSPRAVPQASTSKFLPTARRLSSFRNTRFCKPTTSGHSIERCSPEEIGQQHSLLSRIAIIVYNSISVQLLTDRIQKSV